jgi:tRNA(fMet)-specific endonuclease VapC
VFITIITFEEQTRGWLAYVAGAKARDQQIKAYSRLHALLNEYRNRQVLDFDEAAMSQFEQLTKMRIRIGAMDLKIAATVVSKGATLLSRNLSDFRKVPGLQVEDWSA